jgi:hypothetical protein
MANSVKTNPIYVDTAGVLFTGPGTIKAIYVTWISNDDDFLLSDAAGNIIFQAKASSAIATAGNSSQLTVPGGIKVNGLTCTTIDGTSEAIIYLQ